MARVKLSKSSLAQQRTQLKLYAKLLPSLDLMPAPRMHSGGRSPAQLRHRLEEVEQLIEDAAAERASLTRWCMLFVRHMNLLEDRATLEQVSRQTLDAEQLFGLEAWAPAERLDDVAACAERHGLAWEASEPTSGDSPPTLLHTPASGASPGAPRTASIVAVKESLITIDVTSTAVSKNEVGYIVIGQERLMAEVLRIEGGRADMQVFEDTRGVKVGDLVELSGKMLSVSLGPGMLGHVFDGLQNPLSVLAEKYGFFLPRGADMPALDQQKKWDFEPKVKPGDRVQAGSVLGTTKEGPFEHRIMVPFDLAGTAEVTWAGNGALTITEPVARIKIEDGSERELTMTIRWPVRRPVPAAMLARRQSERLYPDEPLITTQRIIDTFFPIARGGTACIPGPFGAGKTVLQSAIARNATVDIVVIIACGERAGEVVETITEYPETKDPRTGGSLMDRTIIVCNTSSMPVAARESSIYTGITIGEYYRQMGFNVLCIADSTSRWAQAMRETSGRMEEIPGEEAFPAYLDSAIKNVYERAGVIKNADDSIGSLTLIGTVSPAGGNFEEPVTQATLATVKTFLGLSYDRAYKRFYPAIDPLISWSRYLDQLAEWYGRNLSPDWVANVKRMAQLLRQGDGISQMMQVTGEEGVTFEDFVVYQKALLLDMVYLQQDAFDPVDSSMPLERQVESFGLVGQLIGREYKLADKDKVRDLFTRLTGLYKNMNYSAKDSPQFTDYRAQIDTLVTEACGEGAEPDDATSDAASNAAEMAAPAPASAV